MGGTAMNRQETIERAVSFMEMLAREIFHL